ncbi:2-hydroxy-6-oxonona-2,4-dienedioate hydrolase [Microdochium nivale]|nr:2-hydroxy-6-oxonona-2,4-dienedioate hydrolase [Microdochium nivale]
MDRNGSTEASPPGVPRTPYQPRSSQRRKPVDPAMHLRLGDSRGDSSRAGPSPASPEVISSLITSLSVISKPASNHFEGQSVSMPSSPLRNGSFGVEYGAYSPQPLSRLQEEDVDLDELAASPPVVRTSKPPSGYSSLTAPKSPRRDSSGFKSLLRSPSRPSSKSSASSFPDDNASIGNLSVERGSTRSVELNHKSSHDSWGKRQSRSQKVLAYMSSREQLRASDTERKRASGNGADSSSGMSPNPETLQFETSVDEERGGPATNTHDGAKSKASPSETNGYHIPARESSLKKAIASTKRSSNRLSHTRRRSDGALGDMIPEYGEDGELRDLSAARHRQNSSRKQAATDTAKAKDSKLASKTTGSDQPTTARSSSRSDIYASATDSSKLAVDDSAPFPSISSGSRRGQSADRRRSGRTTPEPGEALHSKRSSSRAKRLSAGGRSSDAPDKRGVTPEPTVGYERPQSADSIDGAVESYLCSPRLSQKIRHPQTGRIISFSEVGDAEGSAVFCCVGMGLTRYITAFYDELALTLKLRLITPDRPGVGDSEAYAGGTATPLSWPDDVYAICQALKITKFSILAHSAGAIYALATALRMPQHIRGRIHLLAPWIPPSQMNVFGGSQASPPANSIPTSQRILRALPTPFLKAANSSFMSATSSSITSSLPKNSPRRSKRKPNTGAAANGTNKDAPAVDKESFVNKNDALSPDFANGDYSADMLNAKQQDRINSNRSPDPQAAILSAAEEAMNEKERQGHYDLRLTHAIWDLATTGANPAVDLLVCLERRHTIGFRYVDITRPVVIHHGSKDTRVPVENVRWLGKTMRRCEVRVLEGEGHGLMASATVMGSVLMEISKEWDDWNQATGSGSRREDGRERGRSLKAGFR